MSEFVANDVPDAAEIHRIIHSLVEEWRLQNAGGEDDLIARAVVISVDRRRRHAPFLAIERLIDLGDLPARFKFVGPLVITQQVAVTDAQFGIVAPNIGIADLVADSVEFYFGLFLGVCGHPGQASDVFIQRLLQRGHHFQHALLAFGAEGALHVTLAQRFAKSVIGGIHAALPARLDFGLAGKELLHFEIGVNERLA